MDLEGLKQQLVKEELEINENYKNIFSFIDFGNVNNWFENDEQDWNNKLIKKTKKALQKYNAKTLIIGGGVSANKEIRNFCGCY